MHNTKAYKTRDGRLFDDEAEAARHEATMKIHDWARRHNINALGATSWEFIAEAMLEDGLELAHLFSNLARSLPRSGGLAPIDETVTINS